MSRPGFAFRSATTARGSSLTMRTPGCVAAGSVREKTTTSSPGMAPCPPCAVVTSYVLRPMIAVSNSLYSAAKSMAGSFTIQSNSPLGPAMKPSRLIATWYRSRLVIGRPPNEQSVGAARAELPNHRHHRAPAAMVHLDGHLSRPGTRSVRVGRQHHHGDLRPVQLTRHQRT